MSLLRKLDPRHWRYIRRTFTVVRARLFGKDIQKSQVVVDTDIDAIRRLFGRRYFTNAWELSYHYNGEDLNMRRPLYIDDEYEWYQLHVRGFEREDGSVGLYAHVELEPTEHPYGHIQGTNMSDEQGREMITDILDDASVTYEPATE